MWRCPHCGTPQPETSRCWVCRRSSTTCSTCRHFRQSLAPQVGYCGLDARRLPLRGDELRGCWSERPAADADDEPTAAEAKPSTEHQPARRQPPEHERTPGRPPTRGNSPADRLRPGYLSGFVPLDPEPPRAGRTDDRSPAASVDSPESAHPPEPHPVVELPEAWAERFTLFGEGG